MSDATPIDDGGPAFPVPDVECANGQIQFGSNGMSLRDWFAGQVLPSIRSYGTGNNDDVAFECYLVADAMIAARKKGAK